MSQRVEEWMTNITTIKVKYGDLVRVEPHDESGVWLDLVSEEGMGVGARLTRKQVKRLRKALKTAVAGQVLP